MSKLKIFIIAGEASGDILGASLMRELRIKDPAIEFAGVGGSEMSKEGLSSLFPMQQISLFGLFEILPHLFRLWQLVKMTCQSAIKMQPDVIITVDSPGFCWQVVKKIHSILSPQTKFVHYVAPSIWAYKPRRINFVKQYYDLVLALLPFEQPLFQKHGVKCIFVGHPIIERPWNEVGGDIFREKYGISAQQKIIGVMCGSRAGEIKNMLPVFVETIKILDHDHSYLWLFPTVNEELSVRIKQYLAPLNIYYKILINEPEKISMLKAMDFAIVKSGTSSLELAMAKVPMIVAYKINIFTAFLLKYLYKFNSFASIVNILAQKEIIPEFLQENCQAAKLAQAMKKLSNSEHAQHQLALVAKSTQSLYPSNGQFPSANAAEAIQMCIAQNKM